MKNNKKVLIIVLVVVLVLGLLLGLSKLNKNKVEEFKTYVDKTEIGKTSGYKFDLRIFGTYKDTRINEIVMVNNYKNEDKSISFTKINNGEEVKKEYVIKGKDFYEVKENKLEKVDNVFYQNTDIFLKGVKEAYDVKASKDETIGKNTYKVYTATVSKDVVNEMIEYTDLGFKVDKDASLEVWLTNDNYVYRAYYRIGDLTIYPSYFGFDKVQEVNLNMYK